MLDFGAGDPGSIPVLPISMRASADPGPSGGNQRAEGLRAGED